MAQQTKNFTLRLPLETATKLMAEAKEESRSLHGHIVWILNQYVKEPIGERMSDLPYDQTTR